MNKHVNKLVLGCGYLGHRVAKVWQQRGSTVGVVTRSAERARLLEAEGFATFVADVTDAATLTSLPQVETILFAVGYDRKLSQHSIENVYAGGLQNVLNVVGNAADRFIYISSTGVYGSAGGDWIDEETPPAPSREGGRACLAAEQILLAHKTIAARTILRLAGIYGPGRVPNREDLLAGKPLVGAPDGWLNLIHVDDAVRAVVATEKLAAAATIFNVADGNPARRRDYYQYLAELYGAPQPHFVPPGPDATERTRGGADKRIGNAKLLAATDVSLQYLSYREGLAAIVQEL